MSWKDLAVHASCSTCIKLHFCYLTAVLHYLLSIYVEKLLQVSCVFD